SLRPSPFGVNAVGIINSSPQHFSTATSTGTLSLSHPPTVCDTYTLNRPVSAVDGLGASESPCPPFDAVYQSKLAPLAWTAISSPCKQSIKGDLTDGEAGIAFTVNCI